MRERETERGRVFGLNLRKCEINKYISQLMVFVIMIIFTEKYYRAYLLFIFIIIIVIIIFVIIIIIIIGNEII